MLSNTLNTNEVKNSAGTEIEFSRIRSNDRSTEFAKVGESPSAPYRLSVSHQEFGTGIRKRRRGVVRFDKTVMSDVDATVPVVVSGYVVLDSPIGALTTNAEPTNVLANVSSFLASLGASTTILYDGTGNGSVALLNGTL